MSAGYRWSVQVDDDELQFKSVDWVKSTPCLEKSARANPDGTTNVGGFTSRQPDNKSVRVECEEYPPRSEKGDPDGDLTEHLEDDQYVTLTNGEYPLARWAVSYDGVVLLQGTGLFVEEFGGRGDVPGPARLRLVFWNSGAFEEPLVP